VGTREKLNGVKKLELWCEDVHHDGWRVDFIKVIDNQTKDFYCFYVNGTLDENSSLKTTHILLEYPSVNVPCSNDIKSLYATSTNPQLDENIQRNFTIRTKTGNQIEAGSTMPIHIQLLDKQNRKSEDIRLKHRDRDKHNFESGAIDEFEVTSFQPLSDQILGIRVKHNADKYQGWYAEWIEIIDEDNKKRYCFPIQRWLDKAENDKQTDVYFTTISDVACDSLPDTTTQFIRESLPTLSTQYQLSSQTLIVPMKNTYHVKTKTAKKGFLGLSPTGTNANVFLRLIDRNGEKSENLRLDGSLEHKNKFERGQIDIFDVGTNKSLTNIDQIELWTDGKGLSKEWFADYIEVTDNKTGETICFRVDQYLNEKNGGTKENPLKLKRPTDNQPCGEDDQDKQSIEQSLEMSPYQSTFSVLTKTGHTGFLGLGPTGTNAPVFLRIHDTKGRVSEPIQLQNSTRHSNQFEQNQIGFDRRIDFHSKKFFYLDQFDIGTRDLLNGVSKVELWHEGKKHDKWLVQFIQLVDNQSKTSYCFPVQQMLDRNLGLKQTHIVLENPLTNVSCMEQLELIQRSLFNTNSKKKTNDDERHFTIRTKTGNHIEAGSTTPIHIQLFDDEEQSSEDIRLKHHDHDKHNFEPGAIDEFQVISHQPLSTQLTKIRIKHNADKYQGWYVEWIEIIDEDNGKTYCFPIQRWLDKAENDKQTDVSFTTISDVPCKLLSNTMNEFDERAVSNVHKINESVSYSTEKSSIPFQNTYHVEIKTGKENPRDFLSINSNPRVFIQIIDDAGNKSESIQLKGSTDHRKQFGRGQIDEFDIGSTKPLSAIQQLEIWTDGKHHGSGWFADYIRIKDNKTDKEACFSIKNFLNKENGGVANDHLILNKESNGILCREKENDMDTVETRQIQAVQSINDSVSTVQYRKTYHVDTKTGRRGFLGLSPTGTAADVYLRIHDRSGHTSEPISLRRSTKLSKPFESGQIDSFDIGTKTSMESISKLELYHDGTDHSHGWNVEYVNILDNTNGRSYCFPVDRWLRNSEHLILKDFKLNVSCEELKQKQKRSFTVRTKTGSQVEAASTTPIYLRLFDDKSQKSEKIRLKQKAKDTHRFQFGSIDEFHITSDQPLNNLTAIEISHNADKYQGWYAEWISITDNDTNQTYCFPIQRWLDKGELDGKTEVHLKYLPTAIPCEQLPNTMKQPTVFSPTANRRSTNESSDEEYRNSYHVQIKTAKKGLLGLAPTGTDANVFIQIHDNNGQISEPIELKDSFDRKNKFARGKIDEFNFGTQQDLNGIDKLELWTDGKGIGSGWYPEYVQITDRKTNEVSCFLVGQYLNEKYGGVKNDHLIFNKQKDNRLCNQLKDDEKYQPNETRKEGRFQVEVKTGHTGFLGLDGAGTDAPVFLRIYDNNDRKSDVYQLKQSTKHRNKFERNQTDHFIIDTQETLDGVAKIDLWHKGNKNDGWHVDYINIIDNKTNTSYCFPINATLDQNSGLKQMNIHCENPLVNTSCKDKSHRYSVVATTKKLKSDKFSRSYTIHTKTGNHPSAGSTTPLHLQLIDINDKKSKEIPLKKKDAEGHHFAPGSIDEFKVTLSESLSTIKAVKLSLDADKHQGWYGEWISITDDENQEMYCFPIQRWLDKGEQDHRTHVILSQQSNVPCQQLADSMSDKVLMINENQYEIRTKTTEKPLQSKSEHAVNVYLNLYDKMNQPIAKAIRLEHSLNHKIPFQKHHTDKFHVQISNVNIFDIDRISLYHDGQNDGWFCDFVELREISSNQTKCFSVHQWIDELFDKVHFSMTNYQNTPCDDTQHRNFYIVKIKTKITNLTRENPMKLSIKIFGKSHQTEDVRLEKTVDNQQAFQRNNSIEIFELCTTRKVNSIEKVQLDYEFQSMNGQISFEWIEITNLSNGNLSCFPINRLLSSSNNTKQNLILTEFSTKSCSN
ncbi:unnamed protein product, partial [Adineta ricciae]